MSVDFRTQRSLLVDNEKKNRLNLKAQLYDQNKIIIDIVHSSNGKIPHVIEFSTTT